MKGQKSGGRQKGGVNKITADIRHRYKEFIETNFDEFVSAWSMVRDPKDKVKLYIDASKFVVPALQNVNLENNIKCDKSIEEQLLELSKQLDEK